MNGFFVTLFIDNRICQYKIDELIQNSFNGYVSEKMVFNSKDVFLPLLIKEESYFLQSKSSLWKMSCGNQEISAERKISHGDYVLFTKEDYSYYALFLDYSALSTCEEVYKLGDDSIFIGRSDEMNVVLDINNSVSRKCAAIIKSEEGHSVEDLSGKTGIYVNGVRESSCELHSGDEIFIMGTTMVYYPDKLIIPAEIKTNNLKKYDRFSVIAPIQGAEKKTPFVRTPRIIKSQDSGKVVIDPPPAPQKTKEMPFILTAGPSMTMLLVTFASLGVAISNIVNGGGLTSLITSGVMALSMLAGAFLWPALLRRYTRKQEREAEELRRKKYSAYLLEKEAEIINKYERNTRVLNEHMMPKPSLLSTFIKKHSRRLWERTPADDDFLNVRLGLGELDFDIEIQSPNKVFTIDDDPMIDSAVALREKYKKMHGVPISISLSRKKVVGVVGDYFEMCKVMVTSIVALHAPDEVKLALIYNSTDLSKMQWANDLPHVWSNDRKDRYVATNREEAKSLLASLEEIIYERESALGEGERRVPVFVVLVMDEGLTEDLPFRRHLINTENGIGVSTIFFGRHFNNIPKECSAIIQKDNEVCGMYIKNENNNKFIEFTSDEVSEELINEISAELNRTPVKTERGKSSVPDRVNFLDMFRVGNVGALEITNHWGTNISEKSLAAPVGVKAGGEVFSLDIHEKYHGCHGLVAGTTGSGKSEFLQAYILSMMINYSPNEVAFVLVDFKGGDMARPFLKSPHLAATISNLSENTLKRALISLEAEVKHRQNIFNQSAEKLGVDKIDINSYQKHFKDKKLSLPLPHLIIVIDEFAQLKSQHPEFMSKLVDIAQVGRSLGIHLILATQRPSGVVDPQIWSNSRFKVCLKVLDKQDSLDMINHPEAALIKQPGRAYVQVGYDEVFEQIQSGYSGADYIEQAEYIDEDSVSVSMVSWPAEKIRTAKQSFKDRRSERTQLEEIVSVIAEIGNREGLKAKKLWLPPLSSELLLSECQFTDSGFMPSKWDKEPVGGVVVGMADYPERQAQSPYTVNFLKDGHLAIYGSSGVGKSTLIQTIIYSLALKYSPELFNVMVLDFDGNSLANIASMPHCIRYATGGDDEGVEASLSILEDMIHERHEMFARAHCANYESYVSASGEKLPIVVAILDNYAAFREKMYKAEDALVQIVSAARSCGIYLIVTGNSKGAIYYKITEQISSRIVLTMNDSGAYRDILNAPIPIIPEQARGRALTVVDKRVVEVQFAVPYDVSNESNRTSLVMADYNKMSELAERPSVNSGTAPKRRKKEANSSPTAASALSSAKRVGLEPIPSNEVAFRFGKDITTGECMGFTLSESKRIFVALKTKGVTACEIINAMTTDFQDNVYLISSSRHEGVADCIVPVQDLDSFVFSLAELGEDDCAVIVIDGFSDFYDRISNEALTVFEKTLRGKAGLRIITLDNMERISKYRETGLYVTLVRCNDGVVLGGNVNDELAASLANSIYEIPVQFREKKLADGEAVIYSSGKISYTNIKGE